MGAGVSRAVLVVVLSLKCGIVFWKILVNLLSVNPPGGAFIVAFPLALESI